MAQTKRPSTPNVTLYNLRDSAGLSQRELADRINALAKAEKRSVHVDNMTISRWERGVIERPSPAHRRLLAEALGVALDELGFSRPRPAATTEPDLEAFLVGHSPRMVEPRIAESQQGWCIERRKLNEHRAELAAAAADLYEPGQRLEGTNLLTPPQWRPPRPIPLESVALDMGESDPPGVDGTEPESRAVRPLATAAQRFRRYSQAVRDLAHPGLFENRLSYRLTGVDVRDRNARLSFGHTTYFDAIDVCEALAHEFAQSHVRQTEQGSTVGQASWRNLALRRLIGDPFDLGRRAVLPSINTLTIRCDGQQASMVLHNRNSARVAVAGGMLHVMPAGVFQPSSILPAAVTADFDLWRNTMREYTEEFLGLPEADGDGAPIDYSQGPFGALEQAHRERKIRMWFLGIGLDSLTLFGEILTVAVIDADTYDDLFAGMVDTNDEGDVVHVGGTSTPTTAIPFDSLTVPRLLDDHSRFAPAASACLRLAWDHRDLLLDG